MTAPQKKAAAAPDAPKRVPKKAAPKQTAKQKAAAARVAPSPILRVPRAYAPVRAAEPTHKFAVSQKVRLAADDKFPVKHLSADGIYEVTRLMPQDQAGTFHYRVSSGAGERVVSEIHILPDDGEP